MNKKSTKIVPKILQDGTQNPPKLVQKLSLGGVLGVSCCKLFFCSLFSSLFPPSGRHLGANLGAKLVPSCAKLGASSAKLGPRCAMLAPSWPKLAPKLPKLAPKWNQNELPEGLCGVFKRCSNLYRFFNPFWIDFSWFFDPSEP